MTPTITVYLDNKYRPLEVICPFCRNTVKTGFHYNSEEFGSYTTIPTLKCHICRGICFIDAKQGEDFIFSKHKIELCKRRNLLKTRIPLLQIQKITKAVIQEELNSDNALKIIEEIGTPVNSYNVMKPSKPYPFCFRLHPINTIFVSLQHPDGSLTVETFQS